MWKSLLKGKCYDALRLEVSALTESNQIAKEAIEKYEEEVKRLKGTIEKLEMDKREALDLGLRFESHRTKSKQLETELLSALSEKDLTIEGLQKSLNELSRDVLRNSKEDDLRSICPDLESNCERICSKCRELEHLPITDDLGLETIACQCDQLRSEIAATRTKLENVQSAFSQASCEVTLKTTECERLSRQVSTTQDDFGELQGRYNSLEQQWLDQRMTIETMQADYVAIQQKYQKLQEEYEQMEKRSDEQCKQLQSDNTNLQAEIGNLKERVEDAQRKLLETVNTESFVEELNAQNQVLRSQLNELQSNFNNIQREYESLSNQLLESVLENDALREELKQRPSNFDVESMKSSGLGTEFSDLEHVFEVDSDLMQQFVKLMESIQQIELHDHSGISRLFRATRVDRDQSVLGLKLFLGSPEYIESETAKQDSFDSLCLKGFLKRQRFQIVRIGHEQGFIGEEERLREKISQLKQEVENKTTLIEEDKALIGEMRVKMTDLESDLLEKNVIIEKVESYQHQIEFLRKQNDEMSLLYKEVQDKVTRETTAPSTSDKKDHELHEVMCLKESLAELRDKVCDLQAKLEIQLKQMQLKDENIAKLQIDIEEMGERCSSMGVRLAELEEKIQHKQDQLECQAKELSDNLSIIEKLQARNAKLEEGSIFAADSLKLQIKQEQTVDSSEYKQKIEVLEESLKRAQEDIQILERKKTDEINNLQLDYMMKIETSENENRAKFRTYSLELEESKERHDNSVATLKEQLLQAGKELSSVRARCQADMERIKSDLQKIIAQAEEDRNGLIAQHQSDLQKIKETLKLKLAEVEGANTNNDSDFLVEIHNEGATLKELLSQADEDRDKATALIDEMRNTWEEMLRNNSTMKVTIAELEKSKSDQDLALKEAKIEKNQLQKLYEKSQEDLQSLLTSTKAEITIEFQEKCEQYLQDLDKLREEKITLQSEIQDANAQHSSTLMQLEKVQHEMHTIIKQKELENSDLNDKLEVLTAKITDLEDALKSATSKLLDYDDLFSEYERLKICFSEAKELSGNLEEEVELLRSKVRDAQNGVSSRDVQIEQLRSELQHAMDAKKTASAYKLALEKQLEEVEEKASMETEKFKREVKELNGSINELQLKLESLQETNGNLAIGQEELKVKLKNTQNLEKVLEELEKINTDLKDRIQAKDDEINKKSTEIGLELELGRSRIEELNKECETLRTDLETKTNQFQREKENYLQNNNKQLEEHLTILREKNEENARLEAQLISNKTALASMEDNSIKHQLAMEAANNKNLDLGEKVHELTTECNMIRSDLQSKEAYFQKEKEVFLATISDILIEKSNLEASVDLHHSSLQAQCEELRSTLKSKEADLQSNRQLMKEKDEAFLKLSSNRAAFMEDLTKQKLATVDAVKKSLENEQRVNELTRDCEHLSSTLKSRQNSYQTERERMHGTITSLLEDKRSLEEKLCTVTDIMNDLKSEVAALQAHKVNGGSVLLESTSPSVSPTSATMKISEQKKLNGLEFTVRRNRRITAHDEHRKQSCWNGTRDCENIAVPEDRN